MPETGKMTAGGGSILPLARAAGFFLAQSFWTGCAAEREHPPHRDAASSDSARVAAPDGPAVPDAASDQVDRQPHASSGPVGLIDRDPVAYLRALDLLIPVAGLSREDLPTSNFRQERGSRRHDAFDIHAPRGTPVLAAAAGTVAALHESVAGGNMVYAIDESGRFVLFYAHLDRHHPDLREGMQIERGDTLGYVGTSGNAPPDAPHLHFGIMLMDRDRRWWKGEPIDPQPILAREPR